MHSIHHVLFPSTDLARTEDWYGKIFGMKAVDLSAYHPGDGVGDQQRPGESAAAPRPVNDMFLMMTAGRWDLHFLKVTEMRKVAPVHVAVEVDDWDAIMARLERNGVSIHRLIERPHDNSKSCDLVDPDGTVVEIVWHADWHKAAS